MQNIRKDRLLYTEDLILAVAWGLPPALGPPIDHKPWIQSTTRLSALLVPQLPLIGLWQFPDRLALALETNELFSWTEWTWTVAVDRGYWLRKTYCESLYSTWYVRGT
jgi:hypothetical protein